MVQARSEGCWGGGGHGHGGHEHGILAELRPKKGQSTLQPPGGRAEGCRCGDRRSREQKFLV